MKGSWWKLLGVLILVYVFIGGMIVPLNPGIVDVSPNAARTGESISLKVIGYNTHFSETVEAFQAWLKMDDDHMLKASGYQVEDERSIVLQFNIPQYLPSDSRVQPFSLIINNEPDGAFVLPDALFITQDSLNPAKGVSTWPKKHISGLSERSGISFPFRNILYESIRNTYFHVPLWFAMIFLFIASVTYSVRTLRTKALIFDHKASGYTQVGIIYGLLGVVTGAIWAKNTWGAYWSWDIKQNMTAVALLIYFAYFILRAYLEDPEQKARISAVYNIFAFATLIPLLFVIPRLTDSLHPGAGGNPAFGSEDLDNTMRLFFYPAIIGWTLFGFWISDLVIRTNRLEHDRNEQLSF